jgi:hypothetical protein
MLNFSMLKSDGFAGEGGETPAQDTSGEASSDEDEDAGVATASCSGFSGLEF